MAFVLMLSLPVTIAAAPDARAGQDARAGWQSALLERWVAAVVEHAPGQLDGSLQDAARLSAADLRKLWVDIQVVLAIAANPKVTRFPIPPVPGDSWLRSQFAREIDFSRDERVVLDGIAARIRGAGVDPVRRRAAILHTDVMTIAPARSVDPPEGAWGVASLRMYAGDGTNLGAESGSLHWELARMVLETPRPSPQLERFARAWYRATIAVGQASEFFDAPQVQRALRRFPDDAELLLLAGCEREALASPLFQAFAQSPASAPMQADIRSPRQELVESEALFRRALTLTPDLGEARVHLGRVLALQGRHADSVIELERAFAGPLEPVLAYYANLFLGGAHDRLEAASAARAAYRRAAELVPEARAPHLALARIAFEQGDGEEMRARLARALRSVADEDLPDPWWRYRSAQGRHGRAWLDEVRRAALGSR